MPAIQDREYRAMKPMQAQERMHEGGEPEYIATGYACTFDEPYLLYEIDGEKLYEVVDPHAFDDCDMTDVIMQFDHEGRVYARNHNGSLSLSIDEHGLAVEADLGRTEGARMLWEDIHTGMIERMSFCFTMDELEYDEETQTQRITKIGKLYDVSAVSIPANPDTDISARTKKAIDGVIEKRRTERSAEEERKQAEKMAEARAAAEEAERKAKYKLRVRALQMLAEIARKE